jgi:hypothetical protein
MNNQLIPSGMFLHPWLRLNPMGKKGKFRIPYNSKVISSLCTGKTTIHQNKRVDLALAALLFWYTKEMST